MRPVRSMTTSPGWSFTFCFLIAFLRSSGPMPYDDGRTSTPFIPAMSSMTPRAMMGGNLSAPQTFQWRAPRCSTAL